MYGELDKILTSKNALETIKSLHLSKLDSMFFSYGNLLENEFAIVCRAFLNVDERAKNNKRVSSSFIFAAALWLVFAKSNFFARAESNPKLFKSKEFYTVTSRVLKKQNNFTSERKFRIYGVCSNY
jgi:tRNA nucleotidyltransferase/poly(A) polymerase